MGTGRSLRLLVEGGSPPARDSDPIGGAIGERAGQFFPTSADGIDVQSGDLGQETVATMPDLDGLDGGEPSPLLLVEPAHKRFHVMVYGFVRMGVGTLARGPLTSMDFPPIHGSNSRDGVWK